MLLAHKVELRPKPDQLDYFEKSCGHYRHVGIIRWHGLVNKILMVILYSNGQKLRHINSI